MYSWVDALQRFLDLGGPVLLVIAVTCALLLSLIIERYWYLYQVHPAVERRIIEKWLARRERCSWRARCIRAADISMTRMRLTRTLPLLSMLVALCPLLGLLGTVTGMISVFDVIAVLGTGNVRAMAAGISRATVPTMAGMMVALPGLYFYAAINNRVRQRVEQLADRLPLDGIHAPT